MKTQKILKYKASNPSDPLSDGSVAYGGFYDSMIDKYGQIELLVEEHSQRKSVLVEKVLSLLAASKTIPSGLSLEYQSILKLEHRIDKMGRVGIEAFENFGDELDTYFAFNKVFEQPDSFPGKDDWLKHFGDQNEADAAAINSLGDHLTIIDPPHYMSILYKGENYELTPKQAILVKLLFENARKGGKGLSPAALRKQWPEALTASFRVDKIFAQTIQNKDLHGTLLRWRDTSRIYYLDV